MSDIVRLLTWFGFHRDRVHGTRRDSGASGIETAIITAVLAGIAITLTIVIVGRIEGQTECISSGAETCGQTAP